MYSITVNINGKPHSKSVPQSWNDLQWIDYLKALTADIQDESDVDAVLEALTGIPKIVLAEMQPYDHRFILTQCSFFWKEAPVKMGLPHDFVRVQIENDTWQKLIDAEQEFKRVTELNLPQIAAAQVVIKTYSGIDIKSMKVPEALAYWDFFFSSSLIGQNVGKTSIHQKQMKTRLQQGLKRSKRLNGLRHSMRLQKEIQQNMTLSSLWRLMSFTRNYCSTRQALNIRRGYENTTSSSINHRTSNESTNC